MSLAAPSMNLWGEGFSVLGCDSCNYNEVNKKKILQLKFNQKKAINSCKEHYHLCSLKELYAGGYHIARIMGWFRFFYIIINIF